MKKVFVLLLTILSLGSYSALGQETQKKLEKLAKDPKTTENAAKADVYTIDKTKISDSARHTSQPVITTPKKKKSKKQCKH